MADGAEPVQVECYSGHTYAQRPESFVWRGIAYRVQTVEKMWREPGCLCFRVGTPQGRFELRYLEREDGWSIVPLLTG